LIAQLDNCWRINEYKNIKSRLHLIDREIAIESGDFERYSLVVKINERIDELENKRAMAIIEKQRCGDITRYRKLVDTIEILDKTILINKNMIGDGYDSV
jgi:hypothetical protein